MQKTAGPKINVSDLRLGLYVHLDLGWMDHPFPLGSFKITSQQQIDTIRTIFACHGPLFSFAIR